MKDSLGAHAMCATCVFYEPPKPNPRKAANQPEMGSCHRDPIKAQLIPVTNSFGQVVPQVLSFFPDVPGDNWCGQHQRDAEKQMPVVQPVPLPCTAPPSTLILPGKVNGQ